MTGTIQHLLAAAITFAMGHLVLAHLPIRSALIGRLGERGYRGLFALASIPPLIWTCVAYAHAPNIRLWEPGPVGVGIAMIGGPVALFLIVASMRIQSPTSAGGVTTIEGEFAVAGITRVTHNPQLWAIAIWSVSHLIGTGTAAATILFGALALTAILGSYHLDARMAATGGERWSRFAAQTSNTPFAALLGGRTKWVRGEVKPSAVVIAVILSLVFVAAHPLLFKGSAGLPGLPPGP